MTETPLGFSPDFNAIPQPGDGDFAARVLAWTAGTYRSNWHSLKFACVSCAQAAVFGAQDVLELVSKLVSKSTEAAEGDLLITLDHQVRVHGPALGAIMLASFASESFVRLGYTLALELRAARGRLTRAAGFDRDLTAMLSAFDAMNASERVNALFKAVRVPSNGIVKKRISDLIGFRNDVAHDSPGVHAWDGSVMAAPAKGKSRAKRDKVGEYHGLLSEHRPVRLRQVQRAIQAHDGLVAHTFERAQLQGWADAVRSVGPNLGDQIQAILRPTNWFPVLEQLADRWEAEGETAFPLDIETSLAFRDRLARRTRVRVVR